MKNRSNPAKPAQLPSSTDQTEIAMLRQKITELVIKTPGKAATILSEWIKRPAKRVGSRKKSA